MSHTPPLRDGATLGLAKRLCDTRGIDGLKERVDFGTDWGCGQRLGPLFERLPRAMQSKRAVDLERAYLCSEWQKTAFIVSFVSRCRAWSLRRSARHHRLFAWHECHDGY